MSDAPLHVQRLREAERLFAERRADEALHAAEASLSLEPDFYWALLLQAKILRWLGRAEWLSVLERAVATGAPENFDAVYELASHHLMHGEIAAAAPLVETALRHIEGSDGKLWYFGGLSLLQALVRLAHGELAGADESYLRAFEFRRDTDESPLVWPIEPPRRGPSALLEYRDVYRTMRLAGIDYDAELAKLPKDTTVLEIGAMDGVRFDPLYRFITEKGWKATLVEPVSDHFEQLVESYAGYERVRCIRCAISDRTGSGRMKRIPKSLVESGRIEEWALGVSSLTGEVALPHVKALFVEEDVPLFTFTDFCERHGVTSFDVLQIDTEGHDWVILRQVDLRRFEPKLVHVEFYTLTVDERLAVYRRLAGADFRVGYDGMDVTAVRR